MSTPETHPASAEAVAAAKEIHRFNIAMVDDRCTLELEALTRIIQKHLSAALASVEAERDALQKQIGTVLLDETFPRTSLFDELTMRKLRADLEESKRIIGGVRHENERLRGVERRLSAALARGKEDGEKQRLALQYYAHADFLTTEQQQVATRTL